jgi:hypothetical protein
MFTPVPGPPSPPFSQGGASGPTYTLACDVGTFTLSGQDATFTYTPALVIVRQVAGGGEPWQDFVKSRYSKRHQRLLSEEKQLVIKKSSLEKKIQKARKKQLPLEGILANIWKIEQKLEAKRGEIALLEIDFLPPIFDEDEDDDEFILLNS